MTDDNKDLLDCLDAYLEGEYQAVADGSPSPAPAAVALLEQCRTAIRRLEARLATVNQIAGKMAEADRARGRS